MSLSYNIPFLSILLAMVSAILVPLLRNGRWALNLVRGVQLAAAAASAYLLAELSLAGESITFQMGHFPAPWGNMLRAGPLEAALALTFSLVMVLSLTGGAQELKESLRSDQLGWYCLLMQLLYGALLAMVYTDDLFTAYVFVEIAAVTACIAVAALAESRTYFIPLVVSALLMTLGLSIKSAQFPFHAWLPDAHASTFTASSAILSGLVLKGYLVIILKLVLRVFSPALLVSICMDDLLFLLGLAGMLFASVAALRQEEVKRMIAFSSSAQISYIFLAMGLGSQEGLVAACYQILAHAMTKSMIFLGAGEMIRASGGHYWGELRGAARMAPLGGLAFTVGGLSLCGLPLLAGFSAKYCIAAAALEADWQTFPALFGLAASSVLNAMYYIPAILAIWGRRRASEEQPPVWDWSDRLGKGALVVLLACNVLLGTAFGPIHGLIAQGIALF